MSEQNEIMGIIEEINEEVKHDEFMKFLKKHQNAVTTLILLVMVGVFAYSSMRARHQRQTEQVTTALIDAVKTPHGGNDLMFDKLIEDAPSEMKPMLSIMKYGQKLETQAETEKNAEELLAICSKYGVEEIWKDLAIIIYASYRVKSSQELIKMLEPLTEKKRPFRFSALELMGMFYAEAGDAEKSQECFQKILDNEEAPKTMKERIKILAAHMKNNPVTPATQEEEQK